jgi:DNA-binding transcriptional LysR family regulator
MTLKQLEALYWAATLGSFALAAERLCTTQSALSKRIQELEVELGEQLFDRAGVRARITAAGERVLPHAAQILRATDEIRTQAGGPQGLRGTCPFGVSEFVASCWLPRILLAMRNEYPQVDLEPRVAATGELLQSLVHGETDLSICAAPTSDDSIATATLFDIEMVWVASPELAKEAGHLTRTTLSEVPVLSTSLQSGATAALEQWALAQGIKFRRHTGSNSMNAVASLAVAGAGVCVLPRPFAQRFVRAGSLVRLRAAKDCLVPPVTYYLHWRRDDQRLVTARLRDLVASLARKPDFSE